MKKLHKKLEKVAEHIDLSNANQTGKLKELAVACSHFELAVEMRGYERAAEQELAEDSKFNSVEKEFELNLNAVEPTLLVNSIKTPDGTVLTSHHRHDYVCHEDKVTGTTYCLDGGDVYRRINSGGLYIDLAVYSDDPFEKIRESLSRVGRGKNFDQPAQWYALKDMNDNWLAELIPWIEDNQPNNKYKKYYLQEIEYRKANGITVKEEE